MWIFITIVAATIVVYVLCELSSYITWYCDAYNASRSKVVLKLGAKFLGTLLLIVSLSYGLVRLLNFLDTADFQSVFMGGK